IFADRKKLDRASPFTNRVFVATQSGIKKSEHGKAGGIIGLIPSYLLHRRTSLLESGMSGIGVAFRAGDETLTPLGWKFDILKNALARSHRLESEFSRSKVTFRKSDIQPLVSELRDGSRFLCENRSNRFVQRFRIGMPMQFVQA